MIKILALNLILSLIYLIWNLFQGNHKKGFIMAGFMILAPIIGPLYLFISWLVFELFFKRRKKVLNVEELSLSKDKIETIKRADMESALNKVPLEEALIVSSSQKTRRLLLNILKEDTLGYENSIYKATNNIDSEVSHYAATAITDIMDKFKDRERELRKTYNEEKGNKESAQIYWCFLSDFLRISILPSLEQKRYLKLLEDLTLDLEKDKGYKVTGEMYYKIANIFMELGMIEESKEGVEKALSIREENLCSYKIGLKFYYINREKEKYSSLLKELMRSNVRLDKETLELIRFYNQ